MPRVSVVIPTYNRAHLLGQTIESALAQTFADFEVIVVDDGSTDTTMEVLDRYSKRIRILQQENQKGGGALARNAGIRNATGEFIAFLDSDDLWLPTKLEHQIAVLNMDSNLSWVYTDAEVFESESNRTLYVYSRFVRLHEGDVLPHLICEDFIPSSSPIVRRTVFNEVGDFWPSPKATDWDMWLRIAARYRVGLIKKPLVRYRVHKGRITDSHNWKTAHAICNAVIERAVERESNRLAPLKKHAIAILCIGTGRTLAQTGERAEARHMFTRAIRLAPRQIDAYVYWLGCLIGQPILDLLIQLRRWIRYRCGIDQMGL
jgi:glycosyltransferase involved in cell wall biosynthesis